MAPTTGPRPMPPVSPDAQLHRRERGLPVEAYLAMGEMGVLGDDDRVELLDGRLIDMPPMGPSHSHGVDDSVERFPGGCAQTDSPPARARALVPVQLDEHSLSEPRARKSRMGGPPSSPQSNPPSMPLPDTTPLLRHKAYDEPSVFRPANLLREARRQNEVEHGSVPDVCLLDPDGDIVDHLKETDRAEPHPHWPGYHTTLYATELNGRTIGVLGRAVGSSFAVLVAEQLFAAGCELLLSITSAGQIVPRDEPPYFVLIERALRDEGTSHHYRPPSEYAALDASLQGRLRDGFSDVPVPVHGGATWTTDAPYRETESAIAAAREAGILAVEMEAAALYTFAAARDRSVVCFAHVTNQMAVEEGDFEKGEGDGAKDALALTSAAMDACNDPLPDEQSETQNG